MTSTVTLETTSRAFFGSDVFSEKRGNALFGRLEGEFLGKCLTKNHEILQRNRWHHSSHIFRQNAKAFWSYVMTGVRRRRCRSYKVRQSYISRTVWPRIIQFYTNLHTRRFYNRARYDITNYFQSEATTKKNSRKCRLRRLWVEFLWYGVLPPTNWWASCSHMTSPAASSQLQNVTVYYFEVRKTGPAGCLNNSAAVWREITRSW